VLGATTTTCSVVVGINPASLAVYGPVACVAPPNTLASILPAIDSVGNFFVLTVDGYILQFSFASTTGMLVPTTSDIFPLSNVSLGFPLLSGGFSSRTGSAIYIPSLASQPGLVGEPILFVARYNSTHAVAGRVDLSMTCPPGTFSNEGDAACSTCPAGSYCASGLPTACPAGTYNSVPGGMSLADCWPCGVQTSFPLGPSSETQSASPSASPSPNPGGGFFCAAGSTSPTQYNLATCPVGFYCVGVSALPCTPRTACTVTGLAAQPNCYWKTATLAGNTA
jgi:hypothetical protein